MIELIVLDVDGCMTDGRVTYTSSGEELKSFNVKDGFAIVQWLRLGNKAAIITGRISTIVEYRAKELGIPYLYQQVKDKKEALLDLSQKSGVVLEKIAAIGDDLNDYRLLESVGYSFAPADAVEYVKDHVDYVLQKGGGQGAVREMIELLLRKNGQYQRYKELWIGE